MPIRPIEARGYFVGDSKGHVLGISFENGFPCGYATTPKKEIIPIVFVIVALVDNGHDYLGRHVEVMDCTLNVADEIAKDARKTLKTLYSKDKAKITTEVNKKSSYQKHLFNVLSANGLEDEQIAEHLLLFLNGEFLGRTAAEVVANNPSWKFTVEAEGQTVNTFNKCSLEDYE